jgi:hypothetical protein
MSSGAEPGKLHKRLYRIYYTTYDENLHRKVLEALTSRFNVTPREIKSTVLPEFRFLELPLEKEGLEAELRQLVAEIVKSQYVKVDWIDTSS